MFDELFRPATIVGTLPQTLTNGTTADASQVMSDLNFIVNQVNANAAATNADNSFIGNQSITGTLTVTGHVTVEGVTSTGATGSGKFVFDTNPTMQGMTLASNVVGGGKQINNIIIGASNPLAGSFTTGNFSGALTYGGVTLTNAVTGTGKMVLDTNPTMQGMTLASNLAGGGFQLNNVIVGNSTPLAGSFTTIAATGTIASTGALISMTQSGNASTQFKGDSNRTSADATITGLNGYWNGTAVADILLLSGPSTSPKDDGVIIFRTKVTSGAVTERLRISSTGPITAGSTIGASGGLYPGATQTTASVISQASSGAGTTATYVGNQQITTSSDERIKNIIGPTERDALAIFNALEVFDHTWNDPTDTSRNNRNARGVWTGISAQQADKHVPWLVNRPRFDGDDDFTWTMDFGYMAPLFVKGFQQMQEQIAQLKAEIAALKQ